jgi:hypothetical protein
MEEDTLFFLRKKKKKEKGNKQVYIWLLFFFRLGATVPTLRAIYRSVHGLSLRDAPDILF